MEQSTTAQNSSVQKRPETTPHVRTAASAPPEHVLAIPAAAWQTGEHRPLGTAPSMPVQRSVASRAGGWASADRRPLQQRALQQKNDAAAPLQLKLDSAAPIQLARPGTTTQTGKALAKNKQALEVADDPGEAAKLTNANSFESLAELLTGNPVFRNPTYKTQAEQKILSKVSPNANAARGSGDAYWKGRYLMELLNPDTNYEPTIISRIAMALALFTHGSLTRWLSKPGDPDEVRVLLESGKVSSADAKYIKQNSEFMSALTNFERLSYRIEKLLNALLGYVEAKASVLEEVNSTAQPGQEADDLKGATLTEAQKTKINQAADQYLGMLANRYSDKVGDSSQKLKLFNELQSWAQTATKGERDYVLTPSPSFDAELKLCLKLERDRVYAKGLIARTEVVTPDVINDALDPKNAQAAGKTGEIRDVAKLLPTDDNGELKINASTAAQIGEVLDLIALMSREEARGKTNKFRDHKRVAIAKLEESSDEARELFLNHYAASHYGIQLKALPEDQRHAQRMVVLDRFYAELYDSNKYNFKQESAEKFLSRLRTKGEMGTIYRELVLFLRNEPDFDDRIVGMNERLAPATPSDIVQIKGDAWLLQKTIDNLKLARSPSNVKKHGDKAKLLCQILGFDVGQLDTLNVAQEAQNAQDTAVVMPDTYAGGINAECDNTFKDHGTIAGQMHRAHMAGQDKAAGIQGDENTKEVARVAFMEEVRSKLSARSATWLQNRTSDEVSSKMTWWERLVAKGEDAPTTEWRIAVSTRGIRDRSEEAENTIEDLQGVHILDLSNFSDFEIVWNALNEVLLKEPEDDSADPNGRGLHTQWVSQVETLYQGIDTFTFDLNPNIISRLEKEHNRITGGRTTTTHSLVSQARKKLADALSGDSTVQARFLRLGMYVQDFLNLASRVKGFKALDEEAVANRGLQWSSVDVRSILRKEAAWRLKGAFKEKSREQAQVTRDTFKDQLKDQAKNQEGQEKALEHASNVDERVEEYDRRKDNFEAMRAQYNGKLMMIVGGILAVGFSMAISAATAGVASPFLVALISFAMGLAQKAITASIEAAISGQGLNLSPDACWRLLIRTGIELGVSMAGAAITAQIKSAWDANIAGKDWEQLHAENENFAALTKVADKGGKEWYDDGGFLKVQGLFAEAGKEAGINFMKGALDGMGNATISLFTEAKPMQAVKDSLKDAAKASLIGAAQGFTTTLATAKLEEALAKDEITATDKAQEERNESLDTFNADKSADNKALLDQAHKNFGEKLGALGDKKDFNNALVLSPLGSATEMGTEAALTKIPGLGEGAEAEELDFQMKQFEQTLQADGMVGQLEALETALTKLSSMDALLGQPSVTGVKTTLRAMLLRVTKSRIDLNSTVEIAKKESQKGQVSNTLKSLVPAQQSVAKELLTEGRSAIATVAPAFTLTELTPAVKTKVEQTLGMRATLMPLAQHPLSSKRTRELISGYLGGTRDLQLDYDAFNGHRQEFNKHLTTLSSAEELGKLVQSIDVFIVQLVKLQETLAGLQTSLTNKAAGLKGEEQGIIKVFQDKWHTFTTTKVQGQTPARAARDKTKLTKLDEIARAVQSGGEDVKGKGDAILAMLAQYGTAQ